MNNKECAILILISMVMVSMIVSIFMTGVGLIMLIWCFIFIVIIENNKWFIDETEATYCPECKKKMDEMNG